MAHSRQRPHRTGTDQAVAAFHLSNGIFRELSMSGHDAALDETSRDSHSHVVVTALIYIGVLFTLGALVGALQRRTDAAQRKKITERHYDKTLKNTFPASDPPASQYFDIPVNRR